MGDRVMIMGTLLVLGILVCVFGLVSSFVLVRRQQSRNQELDKGISQATVKHPVTANPLLIAYIVIPLLAILLAMVWIFFTQA